MFGTGFGESHCTVYLQLMDYMWRDVACSVQGMAMGWNRSLANKWKQTELNNLNSVGRERIAVPPVYTTAISYVRPCIVHLASFVLLNTYAAVVPSISS